MGLFRRKLYFATRKEGELKCITNALKGTTQGIELVDGEGDVLVITKSYKDIGCFKRLKSVQAIAPNSENQFISKSLLNTYKKLFKHVVIWFDNDSAGIENAKKYSEMFGLPYTHNDIGDSKDPSDYYRDYGESASRDLIFKKINECTKIESYKE